MNLSIEEKILLLSSLECSRDKANQLLAIMVNGDNIKDTVEYIDDINKLQEKVYNS